MRKQLQQISSSGNSGKCLSMNWLRNALLCMLLTLLGTGTASADTRPSEGSGHFIPISSTIDATHPYVEFKYLYIDKYRNQDALRNTSFYVKADDGTETEIMFADHWEYAAARNDCQIDRIGTSSSGNLLYVTYRVYLTETLLNKKITQVLLRGYFDVDDDNNLNGDSWKDHIDINHIKYAPTITSYGFQSNGKLSVSYDLWNGLNNNYVELQRDYPAKVWTKNSSGSTGTFTGYYML